MSRKGEEDGRRFNGSGRDDRYHGADDKEIKSRKRARMKMSSGAEGKEK